LDTILKAKSSRSDLRNRIEINVDCVGIGYYLGKYLEDFGFTVSYVNVGERPNDKEKFSNLKSELYWNLRMRFEDGDVHGLSSDKAVSQLAGIRYKSNARGQIEIESKEAARKRGVKSPDEAEAIMLCYAPSFQHGLFGWWEEQSTKASGEEVRMERVRLNPVASASELSDSQKRDAGFNDKYDDYRDPNQITQAVERAINLGKVMVAEETPECPTCQNKFLARYGEKAWRCNNCGDSSKNHV